MIKIFVSISGTSVFKNDKILGYVWHFLIQTADVYDFLL